MALTQPILDYFSNWQLLAKPVLDGTASWEEMARFNSFLDNLQLRCLSAQSPEADAVHDLAGALRARLAALNPLLWAEKLFGYRQQLLWYKECATCLHVHLDSEKCPNGCESRSDTWALSIAPMDVFLLCQNNRAESATVIAASYYEGLLYSLFCKALQVRCTKHWTVDLNAGEDAHERWRSCKHCGQLSTRNKKRTIEELYPESTSRIVSRNHREEIDCKAVFGSGLSEMIERLSLEGVSDFVTMREEIIGRRHVHVHRGAFFCSMLGPPQVEGYQWMEQLVRFVLLSREIFRELQNKHIAKVAIQRFRKATSACTS